MRVLIVHRRLAVGAFWAHVLEREGASAQAAADSAEAIKAIRCDHFDAAVLDMALPRRGAFAVADHLALWFPDLPVIAISTGVMAIDSSLFDVVPNARTIMSMPVQLRDLVAVVDHYGPRNPAEVIRLRA